MKREIIIFVINIIFILPVTVSCDKNEIVTPPDLPPPDEVKYNWDSIAAITYNDLISVYWNDSYNRFYSDNAFNTKFNYWWQAHGMDVIVDNLLRTEKINDERLIELRNGIYKRNGDKLENSYYDDMEWLALALLRAYNATGTESFLIDAKYLWHDIQTGWNDTHGGGIAWNKHKTYYKNMPANGPAAILALRLYKLNNNNDDFLFGEKIFNWFDEVLVENVTGKIYDGIGRNGDDEIDKDWQWTYNYGTYIGACIELYEITNDKKYIQKAVTSANYALNNFTNPTTNVLKSQGHSDAGLFNGIFIRYLTKLTTLESLAPAIQDKFIMYIIDNAKSLWEDGKVKDPNGHILFNEDWAKAPSIEGSVELSVQLSGQMLMESIAYLQLNSYIK